MAENETVVRDIQWNRVLSVSNLLRSFRIAIWPPDKLALCLVALAVTVGLGIVLDQAFDTQLYDQTFTENMTDVYRAATGWVVQPVNGEVQRLDPEQAAGVNAFVVLRGFWWGPVEGIRHLGRLIVGYWQAHPWFALINTVIAWLVWAFIGGAVCRLAALQFARDERVGMHAALRFACKRYASLLASPVALFAVMAALALVASFVGSLVLLIPVVGELLGGILFFLVLLAGLVLTFLFLFGVSSLGLQMPAIGAEGRDAFDAISRGVNYVWTRPWKYILYTLFSLVYLSLAHVLVRAFAFLVLKIPYVAMSIWPWMQGDEEGPGKLARVWVEPTIYQPFQMPDSEGTLYVGAVLVGVFVFMLLGMVLAFIPSFILTSQTIIYFVLRRQVDFKDLDEVHMEEDEGLAGLERLEKTTEPAPVEPEPPAAGEAEASAQAGGQSQGEPPRAESDEAGGEASGGSDEKKTD